MTRKIPQNFINELLIRTNIVDLINQRMQLKKIGKNYQTNCPFHNDKTPSFTISKEKQFYHCFGCNSHGNAIDFLMHYENLSFLETIEELSIMHSLDIPSLENSKLIQHEYYQKNKLYFLMKKMCNIYVHNINTKHGKTALQYLTKREIDTKTVNFFLIGYSNQKEHIILKDHKKDIIQNTEDLIKAGILLSDSNGNYYNRFRNRIIFPIRDNHGRINGFGARSLYNKKPKYLNSPETLIFKKRNQLYGFYEVKKTNSKIEKLLVVEGYIDVIILFQFKINYAVGTLGTFISSENIQTLFRTTDNIIYCYDGDSAGRLAAWRTLELSLPYMKDKKNVSFIFLPEGEDPDSIIRKEGKVAFEKRIIQATPMSQFLFNQLLKNVNLSSIEEKSRLSSIIISLINKIPGKTTQFFLKNALIKKIGIISEFQFEKLFLTNKTNIKINKTIHLKHNTIRILIGLLVQNPWLAHTIPKISNISSLKISGLSFFIELINICINNSDLNTGRLIELYRCSHRSNIIKKIATWDHMIAQNQVANVFLDALNQLCNKGLETRQEDLINKERTKGLNKMEKIEFWNISKELAKL